MATVRNKITPKSISSIRYNLHIPQKVKLEKVNKPEKYSNDEISQWSKIAKEYMQDDHPKPYFKIQLNHVLQPHSTTNTHTSYNRTRNLPITDLNSVAVSPNNLSRKDKERTQIYFRTLRIKKTNAKENLKYPSTKEIKFENGFWKDNKRVMNRVYTAMILKRTKLTSEQLIRKAAVAYGDPIENAKRITEVQKLNQRALNQAMITRKQYYKKPLMVNRAKSQPRLANTLLQYYVNKKFPMDQIKDMNICNDSVPFSLLHSINTYKL